MRGLSRIVVIGRLGKDPELRTGKNGVVWASFSVATNRSRKEGDVWVDETDWHDVRVFGDDAERCQRRLRRGSVVAVDGSLVYEAWTDDQGVRRRKPRIVANRVQFVSDLRPSDDPREPTLDLAQEQPAG
ncbi:MAG: single-stranded DNA-binding protein [Myxococcota bacterium]